MWPNTTQSRRGVPRKAPHCFFGFIDEVGTSSGSHRDDRSNLFSSTFLGRSNVTLESKSKFAKREKNAPVPPSRQNSDCCKAVLFAPGLRFDGLVPFHARLLPRAGESRGRLSRGRRHCVSQRLHLNQLALGAIDVSCGCSVGDNASDSTQAQRASVEMIAGVAHRCGRPPCDLTGGIWELQANVHYGQVSAVVAPDRVSICGAQHAANDLSTLGGGLGLVDTLYPLSEAFASFFCRGAHQDARFSSRLHRP